MAITSEELVKSLSHETGLKRTENSLPNMLSKSDMQHILLFIVNVKRKIESIEEKENSIKEIVEQTIETLNQKA